jgi:hypothetical protein
MNSLYNSILSDIDDIIDTGNKEMNRISQTPRERLIKIITAAGNVDIKNSVILRDIIEKATICKTYNYISCFFPTKLRTILIHMSKNKLTQDDFKNFPKDKKEYDFRCSWDYMHLEALYDNGGYKITDIIKQAESMNGKPVITDSDDHKLTCVKLNDVLLIQAENLIYIKIDTHRIIVRMFNNHRAGWEAIPLDK